VKCNWPNTWAGYTSWQSTPEDLVGLIEYAQAILNQVVTPKIFSAAAGKANVLTIGIDLGSGSNGEHAELVAVFDMAKKKLVQWTGKSYPTGFQESTLVQVADLDSHFISIAGERVLILGCHDLNMFSPRARANQRPHGERRRRCNQIILKVQQFQPSIVLHHPHNTDTPKIWRLPWLSLQRTVPSIKAWASGIRYHNSYSRPRAPLEKVLQGTQGGQDCLEILVQH
jgi:hypothetical protein